MEIGYIRTSTAEQNEARQEVLMQELGVEQIFIDKMTGKTLDRPELQKMLSFVREGDTKSVSVSVSNTMTCFPLKKALTAVALL